jgi:hypothetical protein
MYLFKFKSIDMQFYIKDITIEYLNYIKKGKISMINHAFIFFIGFAI